MTSFIECQQQALDRISELEADKQQAMSRVTHLEEEIMSHKAHIATLKNELAAACRRPMSDDGLSDNGHYIPGAVSCLCCLSFPVFPHKRTRSTCKLSALAIVHSAPEKFENATVTGHFGIVFEENSVREIT